MPKRVQAQEMSDFDKIVQSQIRKSVVVAPGDPTGGAKLPRRQEGAAKRKGKGKEQYMAVFDREAQKSDDQLDDWLDDTQETTESPDDYVEDAREDDAPGDVDDEQWEDNRRSDEDSVYDPFGDDDEMGEDDLESLDLSDDDSDESYVKVRGHKRRRSVKKSVKGDMDEDYNDLTDDDDDLDEGEDEEDDEPKRRPAAKKDGKEESRRRQVRKSLGADAMRYVDGSPVIKSLVDAMLDWKDEVTSEIRQTRLENKKLHAQVARLMQKENRQMAKALVSSQAQFAGVEVADVVAAAPQRQAQPIRKGIGAPIQTAQRALPAEFDLAKSLDVLEEHYVNNGEPALRNDMTQLELYGANAIGSISRTGQDILRQAKLL